MSPSNPDTESDKQNSQHQLDTALKNIKSAALRGAEASPQKGTSQRTQRIPSVTSSNKFVSKKNEDTTAKRGKPPTTPKNPDPIGASLAIRMKKGNI